MKFRHIAAAVTALVMAVSAAPKKVVAEDTPDLEAYARQVILLVNQERIAQGIDPLYEVPLLDDIAFFRCDELLEDFSHTRPDGTTVSALLDENHIVWWGWGENCAQNRPTPESAFEGWMASDFHRANILSTNFNQIGVGVVYANNDYYWTQVFIAGEMLDGAYIPTSASSSDFLLGDVNEDGVVDSEDASLVLQAAALIGVNEDTGWSDAQFAAADVNGDTFVNSGDAAYILIYAAIHGAGGSATMEEVVSGQAE